ncbi:MAG: aldo/keto reductase [Candidatus Eisenbacteria bacterium]|uniref:Aldo/keto reductase n=1 Tax=Eiseniibacteriota bacterium TaxID=2212470 RepID=A0A538TU48_UNCEI|nr:MAG: aldo/keto reductase [Candidatus Eisenbacteria bacterium]
MNYRRLGASGLKVSEISLGSWTTYGGYVEEADAVRIVRRAHDLGINVFDTADVYVRGAAETVLGKALRGLPREQIVVATKVMGRVWDGPLGAGLSRKHIFDAMDKSLARLGLDYVDLYQAHAPDAETPIEETLEAFEDLVRMGKTRYLGFSNFDREPGLASRALALQRARGWTRFVSSQPRYSLVDRKIEREHLAFCRRNAVGIMAYSPLAQGVLTNKYAGGATPKGSRATTTFAHFLTAEGALTPENVAAAARFADWSARRALAPAPVALAWVLKHPEVSTAIIGATRVEQLEENLEAAEIKLSDAEWAEVEAAIAGQEQVKKAAPRSTARPVRHRLPRTG